MTTWSEFFLSSASSVVQLELLEISHPAFPTLRVVRNQRPGVSVTLETGETAWFDYYPLLIRSTGTRDNLEFGIKVDLGDLGRLIPDLIDRVVAADAARTRPVVLYRTYRSDELAVPPLYGRLVGPVKLQLPALTMKQEGAAFEAKAPSLNLNRTGETYNLDRFPMLRAFLS